VSALNLYQFDLLVDVKYFDDDATRPSGFAGVMVVRRSAAEKQQSHNFKPGISQKVAPRRKIRRYNETQQHNSRLI